MANQLNFVLKLSMEEMALRRVVVNIWNEKDIMSSIQLFRFLENGRYTGYLATVNDNVKAKVSKLLVPESLKKRMMDMVRPIGSSMLRWKIYHQNIFNRSREDLGLNILKQLCWTSAGAVDYRKTAELLVGLGMLKVKTRFKLACIYCLFDYIPDLWEELPDEFKKSLNQELLASLGRYTHLEFHWAVVLRRKESELDSIVVKRLDQDITVHQHSFEYFAFKGNKGAAEYFYQKLTSEERKNSLSVAVNAILTSEGRDSSGINPDFPNEKLTDVLCYLLSLLSAEQQMQVLKEQPCRVLRCLMHWPWQDLFLEIINVVWTFLPEDNYGDVVWLMARSIENSGYYSPNFFENFFLNSPSNFRKHFVDYECRFGSFFDEFFFMDDVGTIKVVFRNVNVEERVKLISCHPFFRILDSHFTAMRDKWRLIELCLREATLSTEGRKRLKDAFFEFLALTDSLQYRRQQWKQFFEFLDETNTSSDAKRSLEGKTLVKGKKLCKEEENVLQRN